MNTKFKEIFYNKLLNESAKQKIQQYKINDPHLINFLYRYESLVEWGKVKSVDDLNAYISDVLIQKLDDQTDYSKIKEVKKTLFTTKVNWERELNILKNLSEQGDQQAQQALSLYESDPDDAKRQILKDSNSNKKQIFDSWKDYILNHDFLDKHPAFQYTILNNIFKTTDNSTTVAPPPINQNVVSRIFDKIKENPKNNSKLADTYNQEIVNASNLQKIKSGNGEWIKIPSQYNDPDNFEDNVEELMSLACNTNWCIAGRSYAENYLYSGDFYIYFEESEGEKIGRAAIRMEGDSISEIRGTLENQQIDDKYVENVLDLVEKERLEGGEQFVKDLQYQKKIIKFKAEGGSLEEVVEMLSHSNYDIQDGKYIIKSSINIPDGLVSNGKFVFDISEVTVKGDFNCDNNNLTSLEGAPQNVGGDFYCSRNNNLTSLKGAPQTVEGNFNCSSNNNLTSLEGAPQTVKGDFYCADNNLTSLEGAPQTVEGNFNCSHNNNLTSLKGVPQTVKGNFNCSYNNNLTSLKGAPQTVEGNFNCSHNKNLTSLEGAPQTVEGNFNCSRNNLTSLEGAPQTVGGNFNCSYNNNLTSLKGAPQTIERGFDCSHNNNLTSLEGAPQTVGGGFYCSHNKNLTSLKGAPQTVGGGFDCSRNNLTSLEGAPQTVEGGFYCADNNLTETYEEYLQRIQNKNVTESKYKPDEELIWELYINYKYEKNKF